MPLDGKIKVLDKLAIGESNSAVGCVFGVNESMIRIMIKN